MYQGICQFVDIITRLKLIVDWAMDNTGLNFRIEGNPELIRLAKPLSFIPAFHSTQTPENPDNVSVKFVLCLWKSYFLLHVAFVL